MTTYNLTVRNDSNEPWDIFTFQKNPILNLNSPALVSLAWFTKYTAAHSQAKFTWELDYNFMWSDTGDLTPGVVFEASQSFPADPFVSGLATASKAGDQAILSYHPQQEYFEFTDDGLLVLNPSPGTLYVSSDSSVPNGIASVGIGMSNAGTFALPALTNITAEFTPDPTYYVAASVSMQQGQVLEEEISNAVELQFAGVTSLTATFNPDHTWSVSPS
jgi:hypothetical protein